jgi:hypothetical protein
MGTGHLCPVALPTKLARLSGSLNAFDHAPCPTASKQLTCPCPILS